MEIAVMPDSFKEGPDAVEIASAIEAGILAVDPKLIVHKLPVSDGGDGLSKRLIHNTSGKYVEAEAVDPLGNPIKTNYGVIDGTQIALIESALTCGFSLVPRERRNPGVTTSYGLGLVIDKVIQDEILRNNLSSAALSFAKPNAANDIAELMINL